MREVKIYRRILRHHWNMFVLRHMTGINSASNRETRIDMFLMHAAAVAHEYNLSEPDLVKVFRYVGCEKHSEEFARRVFDQDGYLTMLVKTIQKENS